MTSPGLRRHAWFGLFATAGLILFSAGCKKQAALDEAAEFAAEEAREERLAWNLKTLVQAYENVGEKNPAWDELVERALTEWARAIAGVTDLKTALPIIATHCEAAVKAGCKDPLVTYMHARFVVQEQNTDAKAVAEAYCDAAARLKASSYPNVRKFYAERQAVKHIYRAYGSKADQDLLIKVSGSILQDLRYTLSDKHMPPEDAYEASSQGLTAWLGSATDYEKCYHKIEEKLLKNWPKETFVQLFKGEAYIEMAWHARGGGWGDSVTAEGAKRFRERLDIAETALLEAWKRNSNEKRVPIKMLIVAKGKGVPRKEMEVWYQRAMKLDPNSHEACEQKRLYLSPWWRGSEKDMLAFGRECVKSKTWGGHVPLTLVDAHADLRRFSYKDEGDDYWKRPEVWPDLKAAFEKFFKLNPDETSYRQNYALYAYRCQQWNVLNQQLQMLGSTNYAYFGGEEEFGAMARLAQKQAEKAKSAK